MAAPTPISGEHASNQAWNDVLQELLPPQGKWSEEEYLVLTDHRTRLVEFTDGFLEVLPEPTDEHQSLLKFLFLAFSASSKHVAARYNSRRCVFAFGQASFASQICWWSCRLPTGGGKAGLGRVPI